MKILSETISFFERQNYWDGLSKGYAPIKGALSTKIYGDGEWRLFKKYFGDLKNKKLLKLDLWNEANNTDISERAVKEEVQFTGIDISEEVTNRAAKNFAQKGLSARFVVGDVRDMPFLDCEFDYVYTMGTIEHVYNPEKAIKEIHRVLKPGGTAIIGVPYRYDPFLRAVVAYLGGKLRLSPYGDELCFSWKELGKLLSISDFQIVAKSGVYFIPWPLRLADVFFYQHIRPAAYLFYPLLWVCSFLGRINFLLMHNGLIAIVVRKPAY